MMTVAAKIDGLVALKGQIVSLSVSPRLRVSLFGATAGRGAPAKGFVAERVATVIFRSGRFVTTGIGIASTRPAANSGQALMSTQRRALLAIWSSRAARCCGVVGVAIA
jgi:hypothetical protein